MPGIALKTLIAQARQVSDLDQITTCLGRLCRWTGRGRFYSVLAHSIVVSELVARDAAPCHAIHGLLHDAAEMFIGDVPTPAKARGLALTEQKLLAVLYEQLGIPDLPDDVRAVLATADHAALCAEARILQPWPIGDWQPDVDDPFAHDLTKKLYVYEPDGNGETSRPIIARALRTCPRTTDTDAVTSATSNQK